MTDILLQAKQQLLAPAALDESHLQQILHGMLSHQVDAADLYFQSVRHEGWVLEDGIVKEGSYNADRGVGVRAISGEKTGFAYANDIALPALEAAANAPAALPVRVRIISTGMESQPAAGALQRCQSTGFPVP